MPKRKAEAQLGLGEEDEAGKQPVDKDEQPSDDGNDGSDGSDEGGEGDEGEDDSEDDNSDEDSCPEASSSDAESADDEDGEAFKEVNVQFEFFDPQEKDFLGLKALLNTYLDGQQYDCSGLVDAIIKQVSVPNQVMARSD